MKTSLHGRDLFSLKVEFLTYRISKPALHDVTVGETNTIIYHYTDLQGLIGIVENQCLFASDIRFVNDKAELQYGLDLTKEIAHQILNKENAPVLLNLIDNLTQYFPSNRYITCFSTDGDMLQQWQSYARNGMGVSIGLEFPNLTHRAPKLYPLVTARKIIYERLRQLEYIKSNITATLKFFQEKFIDWQEEKYIELIVSFIVAEISDGISSFKNPCFAHENEFRFFHLPTDKSEPNINIRTNGKMIIPYVKLHTQYKYHKDLFEKPDNESGTMPTFLEYERLLPIKQIVIGPGLDYEAVREGVSILMEKNEYKGVNIIPSKLPYRV